MKPFSVTPRMGESTAETLMVQRHNYLAFLGWMGDAWTIRRPDDLSAAIRQMHRVSKRQQGLHERTPTEIEVGHVLPHSLRYCTPAMISPSGRIVTSLPRLRNIPFRRGT